MRKTINKLVRDKIPQILADSGINATFRILTSDEHMEYLEKKLDEEVAEFHESKDVDELVDIFEVIVTLALQKGTSAGVFDDRRMKKLRNNGGFHDRILLIDMEEDA